jgi:hypothetical protein
VPALTLGAYTAKATRFTRLPDERGGGPLQRTVNGQLRGRATWVKRAWSAELVLVDDADLAAVLAVLNTDASFTAAGDLIGSSTSVRVERGPVETVRELGGWYYTMAVTLREV